MPCYNFYYYMREERQALKLKIRQCLGFTKMKTYARAIGTTHATLDRFFRGDGVIKADLAARIISYPYPCGQISWDDIAIHIEKISGWKHQQKERCDLTVKMSNL